MAADVNHLSRGGEEPPHRDHASELRASLERRIVQGLAAEWANACGLLPADVRRRVKVPLFAIASMPRRLGSWHPDKRQITLSRMLVGKGRWDDIREVLLHEMAHQVASQALNAASETDHGPSFRRACQWLRANPAASGSYRSLHDRLHMGDSQDPGDRIVAKVHKLMALAESSNLNEAHAAMRKAHELIARHHLALIDRRNAPDYTSIFVGRPRVRHFREVYHLAQLLHDHYFVQGVWVQSWVVASGRMGRVLEISGRRKNVQVAEYVHDTVNRYIDNAWTSYRRGKKLNRYRQTDFAVGIIQGFATTLKKAAPPRGHRTDLPMQLENQALMRYVKQRYSHLRRTRRNHPGHDAQVLADGAAKGKLLVIAKGIAPDDRPGNRMLEYKRE